MFKKLIAQNFFEKLLLQTKMSHYLKKIMQKEIYLSKVFKLRIDKFNNIKIFLEKKHLRGHEHATVPHLRELL